MYRVIVPIFNKKFTTEQLLSLVDQLQKASITEVLLTFPRVLRSKQSLKAQVELFSHNKAFLEKHGISVNAWLVPTVGYGGTGRKFDFDHDADEVYTRIKHWNGKLLYSYCPLDDAFTDDYIQTLKAICSTGVSFVLFEDDFTISGGKSYDFGCACPKHMALYSQLLGREISEAELKQALYEGGENEIRSAWQAALRKTLADFAAKIEREIHKEYPTVRIGLSANSSSYNLEGIALPELATIIAGDTRPFIRLTGAPYWKNAASLPTNMEAIRLQANWCKQNNPDIEVVAEGDTFPRPRHWVPASFLEHYDMSLRADGNPDGILKYMLDYTSRADYETGYMERHRRNEAHYVEIERRFSGKQNVGLNVFEAMLTIGKTTFDEKLTPNILCRNGHLPTMAQEICVDNSIPTAYNDPESASIVFGEGAHLITDELLSRGVILDATAALILHQKGIDVGIRCLESAPTPCAEYFRREEDAVSCALENEGQFYRFTLATEAEVLSDFLVGEAGLGVIDGDIEKMPRFPACYYYENREGQRFLVYSFAAHTARVKNGWCKGLFRHYYRQTQLIDAVDRLQGHPLPAVCAGNPQLYMICKKNGHSMSVGIWNSFADEVISPIITLDRPYTKVDCYHCQGKIVEDQVFLQEDIPPYGFAFFTVTD